MKLVLATRNENKVRELRAALPGWEVETIGAADPPEETGRTFYENARLKARFGRELVDRGAWAAGEDSGLEVEALEGRPGIYSARFAGEHASDEQNVTKLLAELEGIEPPRRAHYVCELVCLSPDGEEVRAGGTLAGSIAGTPRGTEGFGYDPVFIPEGENETVAELGNAWKAGNSHRARAARAFASALGQQAQPM